MTEPIDTDAITRSLFLALSELERVADEVQRAASAPALVDVLHIADMLDIAEQVKRLAVDAYYRLHHVALIRAQGAGGELVSPSGTVGWMVVGSGRPAYVRRMYASELEQVDQ